MVASTSAMGLRHRCHRDVSGPRPVAVWCRAYRTCSTLVQTPASTNCFCHTIPNSQARRPAQVVVAHRNQSTELGATVCRLDRAGQPRSRKLAAQRGQTSCCHPRHRHRLAPLPWRHVGATLVQAPVPGRARKATSWSAAWQWSPPPACNHPHQRDGHWTMTGHSVPASQAHRVTSVLVRARCAQRRARSFQQPLAAAYRAMSWMHGAEPGGTVTSASWSLARRGLGPAWGR